MGLWSRTKSARVLLVYDVFLYRLRETKGDYMSLRVNQGTTPLPHCEDVGRVPAGVPDWCRRRRRDPQSH